MTLKPSRAEIWLRCLQASKAHSPAQQASDADVLCREFEKRFEYVSASMTSPTEWWRTK